MDIHDLLQSESSHDAARNFAMPANTFGHAGANLPTPTQRELQKEKTVEEVGKARKKPNPEIYQRKKIQGHAYQKYMAEFINSTLSDVNIHWTRVTPAGLRQAGIKLNCKTPRAKELDKYWSFFKFNIGYEDIIASGEVIPVKVAPARSGFGVSKDIKRKRSSGSLEDDENEDDGGYDIYHTDNAHPQVSGKRVRYDTAYSYGDAHSGSNSNHDSSSHDSTFNNYIYEYNPEDQGYPPLYPHDEPIPAHSITNVGMHTRLTRLENAVANVQHEVYKLNDLFVQQKNLERENQELKAQVDYLKAREAELMECVVRAEEAVSFARRVVRGKNW